MAANVLINSLNKLSIFAHKNPSQFLKVTAATSFTIGSLAFIGGLLINNKIPKKEKNFMIAQEGAEGVLNLGVFLVAASAFEKAGRALIQKGIFRPDIIIDGAKLPFNKVQQAVKIYFKRPTLLPDKVFGPLSKAVKATEVLSSLVGTILAFNILVPIFRNKIAVYVDKKKNAKLNIDKGTLFSSALKPAEKMEFNSNDPFASFERKMTPIKTPVSFSGSSGLRI